MIFLNPHYIKSNSYQTLLYFTVEFKHGNLMKL